MLQPGKNAIIGLIGGMSWESSLTYYQTINTVVKEEMGGLHSARCLLYSLDFAEIEACQQQGRWEDSAAILADAARSLESAGADFFLICTNTMHKVADSIAGHVKIPFLHIAKATAMKMTTDGIKKAGLLGTKPTMEMDFYRDILNEHGIEVIIPETEDRENMHEIIFKELCLGIISEESRKTGLSIIDRLAARGAEAMILGCTELGLLFRPQDTNVLLYDTADIHARAAAMMALK